MARPEIATIQVGKQGITKGMLDLLEKTFKNHELVKISVLKSATRNREELKQMAEHLCSELRIRAKKDFTSRIIGFTLFVRKWRKNIKQKIIRDKK